MVDEGQEKSGDEHEMPAGLSAALFIVVIVVSVAILSLLLVSNVNRNRQSIISYTSHNRA